ncbi:MAG: acyl-CoA dehydrogenase family protein [Myxococcales bacterium]|nr:acyl-CoA dehydrogenase family protein [Myxococcales bacterium]MCB9627955.1 acyl-CoA dehydrogenase family protein [Sandaracinaceae bacterium]
MSHSETDKSVSFMRSLCMGQIEEDVLLPFPEMSEDEKETLRGVAEALGSMLGAHTEDFRHWDREGHFPESFIEELKEFGAFGLVIPEEHGGLGFGSMAYSRALQEVAKYDASTAVTIGAHSSIGMRGLLLFGNEKQNARFYPKLATGEMIAAFCLTEPGAGSDAASITTKATREGDEWVLDGNKLWITNGGIASFFTVFAKTDEGRKGGMTAFLVTSDMEGVSVGPHEDKMGLRASSTTTVAFDSVRVPAANVLGEVGQGFKVAMKILNSGRTGLGGGSVGAMKKIIELATAQASERKQFGKPIAEYGLVRRKIGHMVVDCYAAEAVVSVVAGLVDEGFEDYAVEAAISKVYATEALWRTVDEGLQIAGGNGFMCEFPYERMLRDCRINRIFEGTNDILRLFIALNGMDGVASQLKELVSVRKSIFSAPIKGFGVLQDYAAKHAQLATGARVKGTHFTKLAPELGKHAEAFEQATRELASAVDRILRKHGKDIIGKQFASNRLAEIMIDLFVWASVMARVNAAIEAKASDVETQLRILEVFAGRAGSRIRANFRKIDDNDDEHIKALSDHAFEHGKFGWDTL